MITAKGYERDIMSNDENTQEKPYHGFTPPNHVKERPELEELLNKNSLDVKRDRKIQTIDTNEIYEIIISQFSIPPQEVYKLIGLTPRKWTEDQKRGKTSLTTKFAILGLLSQRLNQRSFSSHELSIIFSALTHHIQTRAEPFQQEVKDIRKIVMNLIMET